MPKRYYIGLATSPHDPAIAIVDDEGKVLFAEGSERRYQVKRSMGCLPDNFAWAEDIIKQYCAPDADYIITQSWSNKKIIRAKLIYFILRRLAGKYAKKIILKLADMTAGDLGEVVFNFKIFLSVAPYAGASMERVIWNQNGSGIKKIAYDHHMSHAGYACYGSGFAEAVCLVVDNSGEGGSFSTYSYKSGKITLIEKQTNSVSMGIFYTSLTVACGFDPRKGEEWKVMGLAAYGTFDKQLYSLFRSIYYVDGCRIKFKGSHDLRHIFKLIKDHAFSRHDDEVGRTNIAYNGQLAYSEWMNELITNIHKKYASDNLILTGGCALNSSYNGEILAKTPFKNLYVPSAPADDGCALGGALLAYYADNPHAESIHKNISPYLGTEITDEQLQHFLQFSGQKVRKLSGEKYETVAHLLADGKIVGWVQGRAEYGPRALGNRSILADPRKKEIKDIINERVKFREEFRPFAPSILHEYGPEYFEHYQESHYMERTLTFKKEAIEKVPGVVHVNNTGRLQTAKKEWNAELYHLIKAFHNITGVPVLLNTSFNIMGKPIIHTLEDALSTFFTTGIDVLVINDYLIEK